MTPANLALACEAFSGANPGLARQIVTRTQSGDAITQEWLDEAFREGEEIDPAFPLPPPITSKQGSGSSAGRLWRSLTANPLRASRGAKRDSDVLQVSVTNDNATAEKLLTERDAKTNPADRGRTKPAVGFVPPPPAELQPAKSQPRGKQTTAAPPGPTKEDPRLSMDPEHTKPGVAGSFLKGLDGIFFRR